MGQKPYIFDGRAYAAEKLDKLKTEVKKLEKSGKKIKLASIIVGENPASRLYVELKKKKGEAIGVEVEIIKFRTSSSSTIIINKIHKLNQDKSVSGIMVQLPLPENFSERDRLAVINSIDKIKDVDGLRENSIYLHPTSKAVLEVLDYAINIVRLSYKDSLRTICVVGSSGMVGKPLVKELKKMIKELKLKNAKLFEVKRNTGNMNKIVKNSDIIISTTGIPKLIKKDMVKEGTILIDVGSPNGDIEKSAYKKASFASPVPGGIGPVTIACLMENLLYGAG